MMSREGAIDRLPGATRTYHHLPGLTERLPAVVVAGESGIGMAPRLGPQPDRAWSGGSHLFLVDEFGNRWRFPFFRKSLEINETAP